MIVLVKRLYVALSSGKIYPRAFSRLWQQYRFKWAIGLAFSTFIPFNDSPTNRPAYFSSFIQPRLNLFLFFRSSSFLFFSHHLKFDFPSSFLYSSVYYGNSHSDFSVSRASWAEWDTKYHLLSQLGPIFSFMRIFVLDSCFLGCFCFSFRYCSCRLTLLHVLG